MAPSRPAAAWRGVPRPPPPELRPAEVEASARDSPTGRRPPPAQLLRPIDAKTSASTAESHRTLPNALDTGKDWTAEVGQRVSAWFYGEWHAAVVRKVEERVIEVRWESEASISRLPWHYVKPLPGVSPLVASKSVAQSEDGGTVETRDASASDSSLDFMSSAASTSPGVSLARDDSGELEVGDEVSACFYGEWHPAIVRKVEGENVEVLWKSEPSISRLQVSQIRSLARAVPSACTHPPPSPTDSSATGSATLDSRGDEPAAKPKDSKIRSWADVASDFSVKKTFTGDAAEQLVQRSEQAPASPADGDSERGDVLLDRCFAQENLVQSRTRLTPAARNRWSLGTAAEKEVVATAASTQMATEFEQKWEQTRPVGSPSHESTWKMGTAVDDLEQDTLLEVAARKQDTHIAERKHPAGALSRDFSEKSTPRVFRGVISEFQAFSENGWIDSDEAYECFRSRVYLHRRTFFKSGAKVGDIVEFCVHVNRHGQPQASAPLEIVSNGSNTPLSSAAPRWVPVQRQAEQQADADEQPQFGTSNRSAKIDFGHEEAQWGAVTKAAVTAVPEEWEEHAECDVAEQGQPATCRVSEAAAQDASVSMPDLSPEEAASRVEVILAAALQTVDKGSLHAKEQISPAKYREQNRAFKCDLEAACGAAELAEFRRCSSDFRKCTTALAAAVYADRVLQVFSVACNQIGKAAAGRLLGELVLLLPDRALRQLLYDELLSRAQRLREGDWNSLKSCASAVRACFQDALPVSVDEMEELVNGSEDGEQQPQQIEGSRSFAVIGETNGQEEEEKQDTEITKADDASSKEDASKLAGETQKDDQNGVAAQEELDDEGNDAEQDGSAQAVTAREKRKAKQLKKKQAKASSKALQDEEFDKCLEEFSAA